MFDNTATTTVSENTKIKTTLTNCMTLIGPAEQVMMQESPKICVPHVNRVNTSDTLTSACGARSGRNFHTKLLSSNFSFLCFVICLLSFIQTASAMSFHPSTLLIYALNVNGLVHLGKITHINSAIGSDRHLAPAPVHHFRNQDKLKDGK
jgi:hypothetical protein